MLGDIIPQLEYMFQLGEGEMNPSTRIRYQNKVRILEWVEWQGWNVRIWKSGRMTTIEFDMDQPKGRIRFPTKLIREFFGVEE